MRLITLIHTKKVEVIARERIQSFILALDDLILTPKKIKILWFHFCGRGLNVFSSLKLVAFKAENYLGYLCLISLSLDNGLRRY